MSAAHLRREGLIALKFAAVGGLGFLTDISVLHAGLRVLHLTPFQGRAVSLTCAMQVTFLVNGLFVFRCLKLRACARQWAAYMATNGLGNLINYAVFAALVSSRLPAISRTGWALVIGSLIAYAFNFGCTRLMVFGRPQERVGGAGPAAMAVSHPMCDAAE